MSAWPLGVFASLDAGLGVKLEVAKELGVPTIQLHAPAKTSRTPDRAKAFLAKLNDFGISLTAVFGGMFIGAGIAYSASGTSSSDRAPRRRPAAPEACRKASVVGTCETEQSSGLKSGTMA